MFERMARWLGMTDTPGRDGAPVSVIGGPMAEAVTFSLDDPRFKEWMRGQIIGGSATEALKLPSVQRAHRLICESIAMLPLRMVRSIDKNPEAAPRHPLHRILATKPNPWMTPYTFKGIMQANVLEHGEAFALIIRGRDRISGLVPLARGRVRTEQIDYFEPVHFIREADGRERKAERGELLHVRDLALAGAGCKSRVEWASEAISLAQSAQLAAKALYDNGLRIGGAITHPKSLSPDAQARLKGGMAAAKGAKNAGSWVVLEEGVTVTPFEAKAVDAQVLDQRRLQVEEVARVYGVPRPMMMLDETGWGSGIEQLAHLFVRFTLNPWFKSWEEALALACLSDNDLANGYAADFDERELLRGTMKDQAAFFAKALGSGGQPGWMTPNETRDVVGLPAHPDGNDLYQGAQAAPAAPAQQDEAEEEPA